MRRWICALAALAVTILVVAGCTVDGQPTASRSEGGPTASVTDSGLPYSSDDVAITAAAGVAPSGTTVSVDRTSAAVPGEWARFAAPAAPGVTIVLGTGQQPASPITIDFKQIQRTANTFVITESAGKVELLPYGEGSTLSAQTDHLSSFWPVIFDVERYRQYATEYVANALGITTPAPGCFQRDGLYPDAGGRISSIAGDVAWPCLSRRGSTVELSLQTNSGPTWQVSTQPRWQAQYPTTLSVASAIADSVWRQTSNSSALLLPDSTLNLTTAKLTDTRVRMTVDPVMSQVRTAALAVDIFIPDEIASRINSAECIQGLISAGTLEEEASGSGMAAVARCIGAAAGGVVASIIGIVADGGAALWTQLEGAIRTVLSADDVSFEVAEIPGDAIGDGSPIPVDQVRGMLGTWKGPINQTGSRKYSVLLSLRQDGRTVVGSVEYPELRCNGYLHAAKLMSGTLHIVETITKNGSCVEEVPLELTLQGDKLHYHFDGGRRHGEGTGLLTRQQ